MLQRSAWPPSERRFSTNQCRCGHISDARSRCGRGSLRLRRGRRGGMTGVGSTAALRSEGASTGPPSAPGWRTSGGNGPWHGRAHGHGGQCRPHIGMTEQPGVVDRGVFGDTGQRFALRDWDDQPVPLGMKACSCPAFHCLAVRTAGIEIRNSDDNVAVTAMAAACGDRRRHCKAVQGVVQAVLLIARRLLPGGRRGGLRRSEEECRAGRSAELHPSLERGCIKGAAEGARAAIACAASYAKREWPGNLDLSRNEPYR